MKKQLLYTAFFLSAFLAQAQEPNTEMAMRYAVDNTLGTARFRGMSGAVGAVGGDLSALNVNPAGTALFNSNIAGGTLSSYNIKNNSNYFGGITSDNKSTLDFNQLGGAFVFTNTDEKSDWRKFTLAINYEKTNDFENNIFSQGTNPNRSIAEYFKAFANGLNYAPGIPETDLINNDYENLSFVGQQAWLGYNGYLINPSGPNSYVSNAPAGRFFHRNLFSSTGYNGKLAFNFSSSYKDKIYLGLNLNAHFTDYTQGSIVYESNNSSNNTTGPTLYSANFQNDLHTYGSGFSFNLGAIAKLTNDFRVGLSYESPTWYLLTDELTQALHTEYIPTPTASESKYDFDRGVTVIYPDYKLQTPSKYTGSLAYIFGKKGLISFDYSIKDYSNTQFKPKSQDYYNSLNIAMSDELQSASEFRLGAEYRVKQVSLRGGYRFEQSPYKNGKTMGDLNSYSAGLGYSFGDSRIDLAYSYAQRDYYQSLLSRNTDAAKINSKNNNVTLSYTFNF